MNDEAPLAWERCVASYVITSSLLAAAWRANFAFGLWTVNALAGALGIALGLYALGNAVLPTLGFSARKIALGIAFGLGLVIATQVAARVVIPLLPPLLAETERLYAMLRASLPAAYFAPLIGLVVVAEELVYRGVVTTCLRQRLGPTRTVAVATALYVLPLIASGSWLLVAIGAGLGATWTAARLWSRSLAVPLIAHILWSCSTFVVFPVI